MSEGPAPSVPVIDSRDTLEEHDDHDRSPTRCRTAIEGGIIWGLAFEGLPSAFVSSIGALDWLVDFLLRANGYSLVRAITGNGTMSANGPGAFSGPYVSGTQAVVTLGIYLAMVLGGSLFMFRRRAVA